METAAAVGLKGRADNAVLNTAYIKSISTKPEVGKGFDGTKKNITIIKIMTDRQL